MKGKKHKISIPGYDYDKKAGWVPLKIDSELNDDESLAGYSMPITEKMRDHMVDFIENFYTKHLKLMRKLNLKPFITPLVKRP